MSLYIYIYIYIHTHIRNIYFLKWTYGASICCTRRNILPYIQPPERQSLSALSGRGIGLFRYFFVWFYEFKKKENISCKIFAEMIK